MRDVSDTVQIMLARIAGEGENAVRHYAKALDGHSGPYVVPPEEIARAVATVPEEVRARIRYAHENIRAFAEAQRASLREFETELRPGLMAGQRVIPLDVAGAYVPGGRYAHVASALMTITTARVAGVPHVIAASPARDGAIPAPVLFAMQLAGADTVLMLGGVQAVAAMAGGLFGAPPADIIVGPGNAFVTEAKRQIFGSVGIDMVAGPTDTLILADRTADPDFVAWDLIGQAEHGETSPVRLVTDHAPLAEAVMARSPALIASLPEANAAAAAAAWAALGEVLLVTSREDMARAADVIAPEHLHVQAADLEYWRARLTAYGALFLGEETTVAFGDKAAGPNHVLPTERAARYTGGLSVLKFLKVVTWHRARPEAVGELAQATAAISRLEGMEGHARTADIRIARYGGAEGARRSG
nr:histidinol dehydrogenase [Poseidonocella sedimentorum]